MVWLTESGDTFVVHNEDPNIDGVIVIESLPEGSGILRRNNEGVFYYEKIIDPEIAPEPEPVPPVETLEEKISRLFTVTEQNNLITVDAVLGVYEELIALREEVVALKGTSNNA